MPKGKEGLSADGQKFEWEHFKASGPPMAISCLAGCRVSSWQGDRLVNWKSKRPRALWASARSQRDTLRCLSPPATQLDGSPERLTLAQGTRAGKATSCLREGSRAGCYVRGCALLSWGQRSTAVQHPNAWVSSAQSQTRTRIAQPPLRTRSHRSLRCWRKIRAARACHGLCSRGTG